MEARDLIVTPIILCLVYLVAFIVRPYVTDQINRGYFIPALTVRIVGALAVGFIYQFYYDGGDTYNYHTYGSRIIWKAFTEFPWLGLKLLLHTDSVGGYEYSSKILFYADPSSFSIVQLAALFDLITFSSYSATAVLFAVIGFLGSWLMFLTFYDLFPHLHKWIAYSVFFIPSVLFWGSGILKDTVTISCVGMVLNSAYHLFIKKRLSISRLLLLLISMFILYKIKIYILLTLIPSIILWVFFENLLLVRNKIIRGFAAPMVVVIASSLAVVAAIKAGEDNPKYSYSKIAETAKTTAYDIRYWSGKGSGSGYSLGDLDGTFGSMFKLAPSAVVVTLFRPYLWEINNPLMLLSAIEALFFLGFLLYVVVKSNFFFIRTLTNPTVVFCLSFSLIFAFAVGVSTYNFGSLVRYKIPILPFFTMALVLINDLANQQKRALTQR